MAIDEVENFLKQRGVAYEVNVIQHGRSVRTKTGEVVNVYDSGKAVVQGKTTQLQQELKAWCESGMTPALPVDQPRPSSAGGATGQNKDVFVVYGHDTAARESLELLLHRMGLNPIVLANLAAAGDTVIEKLEKQLSQTGNVGFACVLLTPDDEGHPSGQPEAKKYRARQNVLLELGMVLARLNRSRVAILYKESVERPSDIDGLLYLPFKEAVSEAKSLLFRELQNAGYSPDPSAL